MAFVQDNYELIIAVIGVFATALGYLTIRARIALSKSEKERDESKKDIATLQASQKHQSEQLQLVKDLITNNTQYQMQQLTTQSERETLWQTTMAARESVWQQTIKELASAFTTGLNDLLLEQRDESAETRKTMALVAQTTGNLAEVLRTQTVGIQRVESQMTDLSSLSQKTYTEIREMYFNTSENSDHLLKVVEAIRDRVVEITNPSVLHEIKVLAERIITKMEASHEKTLPLPLVDAMLYATADQRSADTGTGDTSPHSPGILPVTG